MSGLRLGSQHRKLDRDRYRRIGLGVRRVSRVKTQGRLDYRRKLLLMVAFSLLAVLIISAANARGYFVVKVDGKPIGVTQDKAVHDQIIARLSEAEAAQAGAEVRLANKITVEPAKKDKTQKPLSADELAAVLRANVTFLAKGSVITVNGQEVVALASEEEARGVISDLRGTYIQAIVSSGQSTVEDVFIREDVGIKQKEVLSSIFRKRDEAVRILGRGTDKTLNYIVQRGDSLWSIAQANEMSIDQLLQANPEVTDGDFIQEGQNLNLVVPNPYVTVASKEIVVFTVAIPYTVDVSYDGSMWPWQETVTQQGRSGEKEITQEVTRENGKEISRVTLKERVLSYPTTRKITRGSKQVPPMGSGQMAWPVQGDITSYYGWRWGSFHEGIDIAADRGTPILAADSGMVSFAGWNGGYGYLVKIDHGGGKETWYGHQSRIAVDVGDKVAKGDIIGYVGSTGNSTGPHLHFEVQVGGETRNPLSFYK